MVSECFLLIILSLYSNTIDIIHVAVYGKTLECVRKRIHFRLCTNPEQLMTYTSRALFKRSHIYSENCVGVELTKSEVCYQTIINNSVLNITFYAGSLRQASLYWSGGA